MAAKRSSAMLLYFVIVLACCVPSAFAQSIGHDCEPDGIVARTKEIWDPTAFWTAQIPALQDYKIAARLALRLHYFDKKRARIEERLDAEEMEILGTPEQIDPEIEQYLRELRELDADLDRWAQEDYRRSIDWANLCIAFAQGKLRSPQ